MPINPADLLVGQITEDEIREFIHTPVSIRRDSFTVGSADLDMSFRIPGTKLKAAVQWILGVDYVDNNNNLRRSLPMFHPFWNWAWARQISIHGQVYDKDDLDSVVWDFQVTPAAWKQYDVTVAFDIPPFRMLEDIDVDKESQRFTTKLLTLDTKIVSIENGQVIYEAPNKAWNIGPRHTTIPVARRDGAGYRVIWHRVPAEFIQKDDDTAPEKFMMAKGKVNDAPFFGCAAETMLLIDVKMDDKYVCPILTDQLGQLSYLYRIEFLFQYVRQLKSQMGDPNENRRGHNFMLGPEMAYWRTRNAKPPNRLIFEPIAMDKLFTHYSDTYV